MVGYPASGKSTRVKSLCNMDPDAFVYSTDNLIEEWGALVGWSYDMAFDKYVDIATKQMNEWLDVAIKNKQNIIWDQTNTGVKKRKAILSKIPKDYRTECHAIMLPSGDSQNEDWEYRLNNRPGKSIPDFIVSNMSKTYTLPARNEGFDDVYIYDMYGNEVTYEC